MGQVNQQHCLFVKRFINKPNAKMYLAEELISIPFDIYKYFFSINLVFQMSIEKKNHDMFLDRNTRKLDFIFSYEYIE